MLLYDILGQAELRNRTQSISVVACSLGGLVGRNSKGTFEVMDKCCVLIAVVVTFVNTLK